MWNKLKKLEHENKELKESYNLLLNELTILYKIIEMSEVKLKSNKNIISLNVKSLNDLIVSPFHDYN